MTESPPRKHGVTPSEDERVAKQVLLRLRPSVRRSLDALARRWRVSRSEAVTRLVEEARRGESLMARPYRAGGDVG